MLMILSKFNPLMAADTVAVSGFPARRGRTSSQKGEKEAVPFLILTRPLLNLKIELLNFHRSQRLDLGDKGREMGRLLVRAERSLVGPCLADHQHVLTSRAREQVVSDTPFVFQ